MPRGRVRYYARGARRHVCAHAMWLVVGARFVRACLDLCGSELARDGGMSVNDGVGCGGLIASKLAPTGISGDHKVCVWQKSSVGASLLAMAECQSTMVLDVMASSRASSLPQGIWAVHGFCARQKSKCGSELARDGGVSVNDGAGCGGLIASKLAPTRDLRCTRFLCATEIQLWERACSRWRHIRQPKSQIRKLPTN